MNPNKQPQDLSTEETNPQVSQSYPALPDESYADPYANHQLKAEELDPANYQDPQNYENYPADYSTQDYSQYEQYDPNLYQQTGDETQGQTDGALYDNQQYENYGNDYLENQQVSHVDSNPSDNVS